MAPLSRIRLNSFIKSRYFSSILHRDCSTQPTKQKPQDLNSLIDSENEPEKILDICRTAFLNPNHHLDRTSFSNAMSKLRNYKPFHGIPCLLEELKSRPYLQNEGFFSNVISFYGQSGFINLSIKTFQQMEEMGISLSTKTLNYLLFECVRAKRYDEVKRVFLEFPKIYNLKPNLVTYNTVIVGLCKSGSSSSVYSILAEMEKNKFKPDTATFETILGAFFMENKLIDVEKVLEIMEKQQDHLDNIVSIYELRIKSLCKLYRSSEANSLFEEMLSRGVKPTPITYCHLIKGFCYEGALEEAERIFGIMPKKGYHFPTLKMFVDTLASSCDFDTAREVIREIKKYTEEDYDLEEWEEIDEVLAKGDPDLSEWEDVEEAIGKEVSIEETLPQEA